MQTLNSVYASDSDENPSSSSNDKLRSKTNVLSNSTDFDLPSALDSIAPIDDDVNQQLILQSNSNQEIQSKPIQNHTLGIIERTNLNSNDFKKEFHSNNYNQKQQEISFNSLTHFPSIDTVQSKESLKAKQALIKTASSRRNHDVSDVSLYEGTFAPNSNNPTNTHRQTAKPVSDEIKAIQNENRAIYRAKKRKRDLAKGRPTQDYSDDDDDDDDDEKNSNENTKSSNTNNDQDDEKSESIQSNQDNNKKSNSQIVTIPPRANSNEFGESTRFYGNSLIDYQGRSYLHPPSHLKPVDWSSYGILSQHKCFVPKQVHSTLPSYHTKGVTGIRFSPKYGHLLLSSSYDGTVRLWSVAGSDGQKNNKSHKCLRDYWGHKQGIRDIQWRDINAKSFATASYDKYIKIWDTETGQVISRHSSSSIPFCVRPHPTDENLVLCGQQNKLVVTWDLRADQIVCTYNEHLGSVNSVTFIDDNQRFVSTSDDKKVFIWEHGIPVVIKHLSEPDMHSMPAVAVHPSGSHFVGQSQDNQLLVFTAQGKYKLKRDKRFVGHLTAGYACQIDFSPDGQFITSGDAQGRIFIWDWKTAKLYNKFQVHNQVTIGVQWHPIQPSRIMTCSWDGTIKYLD